MDFDLISDLHVDQWPDKKFLFKGIGTSLTCVVAGDVSRNLATTRNFLYQLADSYNQVIFVDGNHEHKNDYSSIAKNCEWIENELNKKSNITYLWDSTCVFGSTAIVGTNGWWSFDYLEPTFSRLEQIDAFCELENVPENIAINIWDEAIENSEFLCNIIDEFNKTDLIEEIVVITHTLPHKNLITPPPNITSGMLTKLYNSNLNEVFNVDINKKISTWCFGHAHSEAVDKTIDNVRYISHPRGCPEDTLFPVYYPKLVLL